MSVSLGYVIFYVSDVEASMSFYTAAFGLDVRLITPEKDYCELATGDTTLAFVSHQLADSNLKGAGGFAPLSTTEAPVGASITLITEDVPAVLKSVTAAGGQIYVKPIDKPWGQTVAYVIDPEGILLEVATAVVAA